jgi:tRNA wybutosine-synthesizing protein 2
MLEKFRFLLEKNLPSEVKDVLPKGYQRIGDIVIVTLHPKLFKYEKKIGEIILENIPGVRVVCRKVGPITGEKKVPQIKIIAGEKNTETIHKEDGCIYKLNVKKLMFSKGNINERHRLQNQVKDDEVIVDLFAGIGYFSIGIAKFCKPKIIYAIDINRNAIKYLKENIKLNGVENKITPILGDCRKVVKKLGKIADRVIMGFLPKTYRFLDAAFSVLKENGGIIHYHDLFKEEELFDVPIKIIKNAGIRNGYKLSKILYKGIVKSYAPRIYHVVIDAKFSRSK